MTKFSAASENAIAWSTMNIRAHVKNGRLLVDEPTTLPEGTVLDLVLDDEGDDP